MHQPAAGEAVQEKKVTITPEDNCSVQMPSGPADKNGRRLPSAKSLFKGLGVITAAALVILLAWIFWPAIVPTEFGSGERPEIADEGPAVSRIEVASVGQGEFPLMAEATGYLAPWRRVEISAEISGRIAERPVEEGQRISEGTVLLLLDDRDRRLELAEAEADVLEARAEFAVEIGLAGNPPNPGSSGRLEEAEAAFLQAQEAYSTGELSEEAFRNERRRYEAAQFLSGDQRGTMQAVRAGLLQAEQRVERAQLAFERTRIRAPFDGRVADLEVEIGQQISAGQKCLLLIDDSRMKVEVDVLEADMVHMREGAEARVRIPALGDTLITGQIFSINPRIETQSGTGRVTVSVPNPRGELMSGLYATIHLETRRLQDRVFVPRNAILVRQGRDLVFRVEDGIAKWVYVNTGARSAGLVEILEGLAPGDLIAVGGHFALAHDAPVVFD